MTTRRYQGSCHCRRVRFAATLDLAQMTTRCNCSYCAKSRAWTTPIKPAAFELVSGAETLEHYHQHEQAPIKHFCRVCGVMTHADGDADYMGGAFVIVSVSALDDASPEELAAAPIRYCNGKDNLWQEPPALTSYL